MLISWYAKLYVVKWMSNLWHIIMSLSPLKKYTASALTGMYMVLLVAWSIPFKRLGWAQARSCLSWLRNPAVLPMLDLQKLIARITWAAADKGPLGVGVNVFLTTWSECRRKILGSFVLFKVILTTHPETFFGLMQTLKWIIITLGTLSHLILHIELTAIVSPSPHLQD